MLVGSSGGTAAYNTPLLYTSSIDFTNQFPSSPEQNWVDLFLAELDSPANANKYFIRAGIGERFTVTVNAATDGDYTLNVMGTTVTYAGAGTDTPAQIATALASAINANTTLSPLVTATPSAASVLVRVKDPDTDLTVTVVAGNMTAVSSTPTSPDSTDYVYAIRNSFDSERDSLSFIAVPAMTSMPDTQRQAVRQAMEDLASDTRFEWFAMVDCSDAAAQGTIQTAVADITSYCPKDRHVAYYWPHVIDLNNNRVPASAAMIGAALRRYAIIGEGIKSPPAGSKCRFKNVLRPSVATTAQDSEVAAENKINPIRVVKNIGVAPWDYYTTSDDVNFQFIHQNLITSVIAKTAEASLQIKLFDSVGGQGESLTEIDSILREVMTQADFQGYLQRDRRGGSPYRVRCNFNNQDLNALENGTVFAEVAFTPVAGIRQIGVSIIRAPLGRLNLAFS